MLVRKCDGCGRELKDGENMAGQTVNIRRRMRDVEIVVQVLVGTKDIINHGEVCLTCVQKMVKEHKMAAPVLAPEVLA
jgi:hypothetical protein